MLQQGSYSVKDDCFVMRCGKDSPAGADLGGVHVACVAVGASVRGYLISGAGCCGGADFRCLVERFLLAGDFLLPWGRSCEPADR